MKKHSNNKLILNFSILETSSNNARKGNNLAFEITVNDLKFVFIIVIIKLFTVCIIHSYKKLIQTNYLHYLKSKKYQILKKKKIFCNSAIRSF